MSIVAAPFSRKWEDSRRLRDARQRRTHKTLHRTGACALVRTIQSIGRRFDPYTAHHPKERSVLGARPCGVGYEQIVIRRDLATHPGDFAPLAVGHILALAGETLGDFQKSLAASRGGSVIRF